MSSDPKFTREQMADFGQMFFDMLNGMSEAMEHVDESDDNPPVAVTNGYVAAWLKLKQENRLLEARVKELEAPATD